MIINQNKKIMSGLTFNKKAMTKKSNSRFMPVYFLGLFLLSLFIFALFLDRPIYLFRITLFVWGSLLMGVGLLLNFYTSNQHDRLLSNWWQDLQWYYWFIIAILFTIKPTFKNNYFFFAFSVYIILNYVKYNYVKKKMRINRYKHYNK